MEISVDAEAIPSVEATGGAVAVAVVGWTAGLLVVRRAVAAGRLGGAGLAGKRAWDLAFDHLNHIHACLTTGLAVAIMAIDARILAMAPIVDTWSRPLHWTTCGTVGYLVVDVIMQPLIMRAETANWDYFAFHASILVGFASCLATHRGGVVVAWGLFSEIDSVVKGWQLQLHHHLRTSRPEQRIRWAPWHKRLALFQVILFFFSRVFFTLLSSDPLLALQALLVVSGLVTNSTWFWSDVDELHRVHHISTTKIWAIIAAAGIPLAVVVHLLR
ncbi:uncharacterized protein AMSG_02290 [Thecamonas trahens ATCC 50062]|uniref:Uncharacterized protein n=1 Tax=Thecamonas trahens ATCC 50062 TaxID=461836 RepID=A0A0L0DW65_THETB|nr:hypothetical protein AMSG_02290 [Thecamonas trahens ATCC 50062]KNC56321.1 hypothetical protein AMSG_02290 [Thecamonas trahens ATCC 50062]|eukprot:XP_013760838.1 hypothetical protein AMSG_02290 [Thecamonas trahens ATCC 50062]